MLRPDCDRISYASELMPPPGYRLERAVATTYSLDLETIVAAAIPLGLSQELDGDELRCPVGFLHAVRKVSDKVVIFCEAGQIKCQDRANKLFPLLDEMVVQVGLRERKGQFPAFHPKTWALQFVNDLGERVYRYIVLSRNLTFDRSWDVAFSLEGREENRNVTHSRPIVEFLDFLMKQIRPDGCASKRQRHIVRGMSKAIAHVRFQMDGKEFEDFEIIPSGFDKWAGIGATQLFNSEKWTRECSFHDLVVVSPFLSPDVIRSLNDDVHTIKGTRRVLITRQEALNSLSPEDVNNFEVYVLKQDVVFGDESLPGCEQLVGRRQDIHAKIYLRRKWTESELFIGSANATYRGVGLGEHGVQNVEMMICLKGKNRYLNADSFLKDLFCGKLEGNGCPFEIGQIQVDDEAVDQKDENAVDRAIKKLCRLKSEGRVVSDDGAYSIKLKFVMAEMGAKVALSPLCSPGIELPLKSELVFANMPLDALSEFFVARVKCGTVEKPCVVKIPLNDMPERRDSAVLNSIIGNKEALYKYLAIVFSSDPVYAAREYERSAAALGGEKHSVAYMLSGVYEEMLRTAVNDPQRIRDAGRVLKYLSQDVADLTPFKELYEVFASVLKIPAEEVDNE